MERRQELEHPLGVVPAAPQAPPPPAEAGTLPTGPADFVLEVGCEELPPQDVKTAMGQLRCIPRRHRETLQDCGDDAASNYTLV